MQEGSKPGMRARNLEKHHSNTVSKECKNAFPSCVYACSLSWPSEGFHLQTLELVKNKGEYLLLFIYAFQCIF